MLAQILSPVQVLKKSFKKKYQPSEHLQPIVLNKELPSIPVHIKKIIQKIQSKKYNAYLVGGCVRDILTNTTPKDFDIATNATPKQLLKLFPHKSLIIGKRFPIVHVISSNNSRVEVTTFRGSPSRKSSNNKTSHTGQILVDNHYGTIDEDSMRRDLTINALYYDPEKHQIIDYIGGIDDIKSQTIQIIGDVDTRLKEDPVRMLRCIRLANKLGFKIPHELKEKIKNNSSIIRNTAPARLFEEFLKMSLCGQLEKNFTIMNNLHLFQNIFIGLHKATNKNDNIAAQSKTLLSICIKNTDKRILANKSITPAFLLAVFLWPQVRKSINHDVPINRYQIAAAGRKAIENQNDIFRIPKRFSSRMISFWQMQYDLQWPLETNASATLNKKDFRAAYDFLMLRTDSGELASNEPVKWWEKIQVQEKEKREKMISLLPKRRSKSLTSFLTNSYFYN